jgi:hypothetical protein
VDAGLSICSMMPPMMVVLPSEMASTSSSTAVFQKLVDEHGMLGEASMASRVKFSRSFWLIDDLHGPAPQNVGGPHDDRVADGVAATATGLVDKSVAVPLSGCTRPSLLSMA